MIYQFRTVLAFSSSPSVLSDPRTRRSSPIVKPTLHPCNCRHKGCFLTGKVLSYIQILSETNNKRLLSVCQVLLTLLYVTPSAIFFCGLRFRYSHIQNLQSTFLDSFKFVTGDIKPYTLSIFQHHVIKVKAEYLSLSLTI